VSQTQLSPGGIATLACMLEVSAPKPGNVHRGADFEDVTFIDFATSAVVLGDVIESCSDQPFGQTVLNAVRETRKSVGTNTNLGMILLIVPLAKVVSTNPGGRLTRVAVEGFLADATEQDGADIFEAIRMAQPGGLGQPEQMDVNSVDPAKVDLLAAMQLAAGRDAIARQYVTGFAQIIEDHVSQIVTAREVFESLTEAIVYSHVAVLAGEPDSLIARKCGIETAQHAQMLSRKAIDCLNERDSIGQSKMNDKESFWAAVGDLDFWLRSDGHRRNPGTTADLIAASLFVGIHNGTITAPFR
jgi:triphosphoribosyl-dephospho-CoA synthase